METKTTETLCLQGWPQVGAMFVPCGQEGLEGPAVVEGMSLGT